jgi:hypothetical protein
MRIILPQWLTHTNVGIIVGIAFVLIIIMFIAWGVMFDSKIYRRGW